MEKYFKDNYNKNNAFYHLFFSKCSIEHAKQKSFRFTSLLKQYNCPFQIFELIDKYPKYDITLYQIIVCCPSYKTCPIKKGRFFNNVITNFKNGYYSMCWSSMKSPQHAAKKGQMYEKVLQIEGLKYKQKSNIVFNGMNQAVFEYEIQC